MDKETKRKMVLWMEMHPDSTHPDDLNRLYDFVREACIHNDGITVEQLRSIAVATQPNWEESYLNQFVEDNIILINHLMEFYRFCANNELIEYSDTDNTISTTSIDDFFNECGYLNFHEIYDMSQAIIGHSEMLTFFSTKDIGGERIITYIIFDVSFKFKIKDSMSILKWIEKNYMEGMDPDSWYGYKCALNNI